MSPHTTTGHLFPDIPFLADAHLEQEMSTPGRLSPHHLPGSSTTACKLPATAVRDVALRAAQLSEMKLDLGFHDHHWSATCSSTYTPQIENVRSGKQKHLQVLRVRIPFASCPSGVRLIDGLHGHVKLPMNVFEAFRKRNDAERRTLVAPCIHCFFDRSLGTPKRC